MRRDEKEFLAWLAGFWEGEGNFYVKGSGARFQIGQSKLRGKRILLKTKEYFDKYNIDSVVSKDMNNCYRIRVSNVKDIRMIFNFLLPYIQFRKEEINYKLNLIKNKISAKRWSVSEKIYLIKNYNLISKDKIATSLDRSIMAIIGKANELKLTRRRCWTKEEIEILNSHTLLSMKQIGEKLNRSYGAVKAKRYRLRLS